MTGFLIETFGPFDLIPAPELNLEGISEAWEGAWDESYILPDRLVEAAAKAEELKEAKRSGRTVFTKPVAGDAVRTAVINDVDEFHFDKDRREKITKTMSYLNTRGKG